MKYLCYLFFVVCFLSSCNSERLLFEQETWWFGHWQNSENLSEFLSIGQKPIGQNEIITTQYFISSQDSIFSNFHVKELVDFNHRNKWKLIETNENKFIKIKELSNSELELYGPAESTDALDANKTLYIKKPDSIPAPVPDSLLFPR